MGGKCIHAWEYVPGMHRYVYAERKCNCAVNTITIFVVALDYPYFVI